MERFGFGQPVQSVAGSTPGPKLALIVGCIPRGACPWVGVDGKTRTRVLAVANAPDRILTEPDTDEHIKVVAAVVLAAVGRLVPPGAGSPAALDIGQPVAQGRRVVGVWG
jgi:hypothetical protein